MARRERVIALLLLLTLVVAVKMGDQLYRWYAFADERERLRAWSEQLEEAGAEVIRTQMRADSLREVIRAADAELKAARRAIERYESFAREDALPEHLYGSYRREVDEYNRGVGARNQGFSDWREVVMRNHAAVARYNALVDSIRRTAERIGEPYIAIPSPAEAAARRGVLPAR